MIHKNTSKIPFISDTNLEGMKEERLLFHPSPSTFLSITQDNTQPMENFPTEPLKFWEELYLQYNCPLLNSH